MKRRINRASMGAFAVLLLSGALATAQGPLFDANKPLEIADQGVFSIPGRYVQKDKRTIMTGAMYVQYQIPKNKTRPYPIILIHGGGQTASNFLSTPDGRRGWADDFVANGYAVYVVDQAGRGRSGYVTEAYGTSRKPSVEEMTSRFSNTKTLWPQAELHTQWPGPGTQGDPVFDTFYATQVEGIANELMVEQLNRDAGAKLLDRIGPAVILTHSQAGVIGWSMADERPGLVKGILSIEPSGPPIRNISAVGPPDYFSDGPLARPWGITRGPLAYDPPAAAPDDIKLTRQENPDGPGLVRCFVQAEPARKLKNLSSIPIIIVLGEASYHAPYDHCTSKWLTQAGVAHDFVRLADVGIRGNGHMMMLEKNNLAISAFLRDWERKKVK